MTDSPQITILLFMIHLEEDGRVANNQGDRNIFPFVPFLMCSLFVKWKKTTICKSDENYALKC